jgi:hypothetical protein
MKMLVLVDSSCYYWQIKQDVTTAPESLRWDLYLHEPNNSLKMSCCYT